MWQVFCSWREVLEIRKARMALIAVKAMQNTLGSGPGLAEIFAAWKKATAKSRATAMASHSKQTERCCGGRKSLSRPPSSHAQAYTPPSPPCRSLALARAEIADMQKAHAKVQQQLEEARLREANLIAEAARSKATVLQLLEDQQQVQEYATTNSCTLR